MSRFRLLRLAGLGAMIPSLVCCGTAALRTYSSGEMGCPPSSITITDDRQPYGTGTRSWTAECNGNVYYCSAAAIGDGGTAKCSPASDGFAESTPSETPQTVAESPPPAPPQAPDQPTSESTDPPSEALGYRFGASPAAVESACTEANHEWTPGKNEGEFRCSGTPTNVGLPTQSQLKFCGGGLCTLTAYVTFDPARQDADSAFQKVIASLQQQYGAGKISTRVPEECADTIVKCIVEDKVRWIGKWEWGKDSILAKVLSKNEKAHLAIRYSIAGDAPVNTSAF